MNIVGWSKKFKKYERMDILCRVRKTEKIFWCSVIIGVALVAAGNFLMLTIFKYDAIAFLLILAGIATIFLAIIGAFIRLAVYEIVSEIRFQNKFDKFGK